MSQASPSKEPSMDEILASIRRIIESSDEKPGAGLASSAARIAAADRAAIARDTVERPSSFTLPTQADRVVPFSERAVPASQVEVPVAGDDADERWVPLAEPANHAGEPPAAEWAEASASDEAEPDLSVAEAQPKSSVEPVLVADRWTREFDDAEAWSVLGDAGTGSQPRDEPNAEASALAEGPAVGDVVLPEREPDLLVFAQAPAESPAEVHDEESHDEDDFIVDFNEADFVEALDRNAALVTPRDERSGQPVAPASSEGLAPVASPAATAAERPAVPAFFGARAALPEASGEPEQEPASLASSVMRQTSAIMSEQAGVQVATAFDDLARAIRDGQMKSMEEMAREMLRPMLQEWLDDNLPRLVERLVREEIERVSRGGRR